MFPTDKHTDAFGTNTVQRHVVKVLLRMFKDGFKYGLMYYYT